MIFDYPQRAREPEILDDLNLQTADLAQNLQELEMVNHRLGAYRFLRMSLRALLRAEEARHWRLIDMGCGGGDALRALCRDPQLQAGIASWVGLDFNPSVLHYARAQAGNYPLEFKRLDLLDPEARYPADIGMFNLVLHHFSDQEIIALLQRAATQCRFLLISDLHRNAMAYQSFRVLSWLWRFSFVSRHDGKLSVRKSFVRRDWQRILQAVPHRSVQCQWHWSFRWNLIVKI